VCSSRLLDTAVSQTVCHEIAMHAMQYPTKTSVLVQVQLVAGLICPAKPTEQRWGLHDFLHLPSSDFRNTRIHVLQKVVGVADTDPNDIHRDGTSNDGTKGQHYPRKIRSIKVNETQETHLDMLVSSTPYVGHHECQRATQKVNVCIGCY
jgi:hypothetical protein